MALCDSLVIRDVFSIGAICHDDRDSGIIFWSVDVAPHQAFETFKFDSHILLEYVCERSIVDDK